jgi:predicted amidohydrolase
MLISSSDSGERRIRMACIRIAAAQSISRPGDISANIATHCRFMELAGEAEIDVLVFPELSLTGYLLEQLGAYRMDAQDARLDPMRYLARIKNLITVVGVPLAVPGEVVPRIGAMILFPDGSSSYYFKQNLHSHEARFAGPGVPSSTRYQLKDEFFSLGICPDLTHAQHVRGVSAIGTTMYLAGGLIAEADYETDTAHLQRHLERYGIAALLANHGASSAGYGSAGRSAIWAQDGSLVVAAEGGGSVLVIGQKQEGCWSGQVLPVEMRR